MSPRRSLVTVVSAALLGAWALAFFLRLRGHVSLHDSFVVGVALVFAWVGTLYRGGRPSLPSPAFAVAALLLVGLGALTRFTGLTEFPPPHGQLWEEAQMGQIAEASIRHDALDHFFPLPNLLAEVGFRLGGYSLLAMRVAFATASAMSVLAFLLAARALGVSRGAAIAATALFATSAYLGAAGRIALESHSPILTLCAALAAAFHAARAPSRFSFALAGACSGLLMTEYTSYRLYPPLLFAMLALAEYRSGAGARAAAGRLAIFAGTAVAVMLPVLVVPDQNPLEMLAEGILRHRQDMGTASLGWRDWASSAAARVAKSASLVFLQGGTNDMLPASRGIVDPLTGVVGLVALGYCAVLARRSPAAAFLLVATVSTVVLDGALTRLTERYRITSLAPIYLLAIALLLDAALRRWRSPAVAVAAGAAIAAACAFNLYILFGIAMRDPDVAEAFADRRLALALEIARLQNRFDGVVLLGTQETFLAEPNDFSFLYDLERVQLFDPAAGLGDIAGIALVDERLADSLRALPTISDCSTNVFRYGNYQIPLVACRYAPSPKAP